MMRTRNFFASLIGAAAILAISLAAHAGEDYYIIIPSIPGESEDQAASSSTAEIDFVEWAGSGSGAAPTGNGPGVVILTTINRKTSSAIKTRYPRRKKFASLTLIVKENGRQQTLILTGIKSKRFRNRRIPTKDGKITQQEWTLTYETIRAVESKAVPEKIAFQLNRTYIADRDPAKRKARIERSLKTASRIRQNGTDREIDFRPAAAPVTIQDGGLKPRSSRFAKKSTGAQAAQGPATDFPLASNSITFNLELFEANIIDAVENQAIGYSYAITRNGQLAAFGADGDARTSTDGQRDQLPEKEMYSASMSKTITATAMLHAMKENDVSLNDPIIDYLPDDWEIGPNMVGLTFRRLLSHRSGLDIPNTGLGNLPDGAPTLNGVQGYSCCDRSGNNYEAMKLIVANGVAVLDPTPADDAYIYTNANFSLMRIIIAEMSSTQAEIDEFSEIFPIGDVYGGFYSEYVQANVLMPAGIGKLGCGLPFEDKNNRTLLYDLNDPNAAGVEAGVWLDACGATGWYMSAIDFARFLVHLRYTEVILDAQTRETMNNLYLGWHDPEPASGWNFTAHVKGAFGNYRGHGGTYIMAGCMINFPIRVEGVLLVNSDNGAFPTHLCNTLKTAFDNAWD